MQVWGSSSPGRRWLPGCISWEAKWLHGVWRLTWLLDACPCLEVASSSVGMIPEHQKHWPPRSSHLHVALLSLFHSQDGDKISSLKVSQCRYEGTNRLTSELKALFC